jgi:hypothetical protein
MPSNQKGNWLTLRVVVSTITFMVSAHAMGIDIWILLNAIGLAFLVYGILTRPRVAIFLGCLILIIPLFGFLAFTLQKVGASTGLILAILLPTGLLFVLFIMPMYQKFLIRTLKIDAFRSSRS